MSRDCEQWAYGRETARELRAGWHTGHSGFLCWAVLGLKSPTTPGRLERWEGGEEREDYLDRRKVGGL